MTVEEWAKRLEPYLHQAIYRALKHKEVRMTDRDTLRAAVDAMKGEKSLDEINHIFAQQLACIDWLFEKSESLSPLEAEIQRIVQKALNHEYSSQEEMRKAHAIARGES